MTVVWLAKKRKHYSREKKTRPALLKQVCQKNVLYRKKTNIYSFYGKKRFFLVYHHIIIRIACRKSSLQNWAADREKPFCRLFEYRFWSVWKKCNSFFLSAVFMQKISKIGLYGLKHDNPVRNKNIAARASQNSKGSTSG